MKSSQWMVGIGRWREGRVGGVSDRGERECWRAWHGMCSLLTPIPPLYNCGHYKSLTRLTGHQKTKEFDLIS